MDNRAKSGLASRSPRLRLLGFILICATFFGCQKKTSPPKPTRLEVQRPLMGTLFRVITYATDLPKARREIDLAFELATQLEKIATDYDPDSELNQLCAAPPGQPFHLSGSLFALLTHARQIAVLTKGAYDPTLGPLTHLWRQTRRTGQLPDAQTLAQAKSHCGYRHLILDPEKRTATLTLPEMQLDLGGIAKGYTADLIFDHLEKAGFLQTLVAAGGDLRLGTAPPEKDGWAVALRTHDLSLAKTITLTNCAVSTSGDLHQKVLIDGKNYSHLIDPTTGLGLTNSLVATVVAPTASLSDPLATAACLMESPLTFFQEKEELHLRLLKKNPPSMIVSGLFIAYSEKNQMKFLSY